VKKRDFNEDALEQDGKPLPGVAQVAIQQGHYAGHRIAQGLLGKSSSNWFRYFDKGNMAVIGAGFAILQAGRVRLSGLGAWLAWTGIHIQFLSTTSLRLSVLLQWIWSFVTGQTGVWIIVDHVPIFVNGRSRCAIRAETVHLWTKFGRFGLTLNEKQIPQIVENNKNQGVR
jgi:hypothetical protein